MQQWKGWTSAVACGMLGLSDVFLLNINQYVFIRVLKQVIPFFEADFDHFIFQQDDAPAYYAFFFRTL